MGKKKKKEKKKVNDGDDDSVRVEKIRFDLIPAPPNVNRGIGKCHAMGDDCLNSHLENMRHNCKDCGDFVHAIGCSVDTGNGLVCRNCDMEKDYDDFNDVEPVPPMPSVPPMPVVDEAVPLVDSTEGKELLANPVLLAMTAPDESGEAVKVNGRGKSFRQFEDIFITRAWISVSADSRNGTGQKREVFASKMKEAYDNLTQEHNRKHEFEPAERCLERTSSSIFARWKNNIRPECSKWAGICKQVKLASGEDIDRLTDRRQKAFRVTYKGHQFKFLESYELLKDLPKWSELDDAATRPVNKKNKRKKKGEPLRLPGKRQQALNDKCKKIAASIGLPEASSTSSSAGIAMISRQIGNLTSHLMMNDWDEDLQKTFQKNQATILMLEQQKEIAKLQTELAEERAKQAALAEGDNLEDNQDEEEQSDSDSESVSGHFEE